MYHNHRKYFSSGIKEKTSFTASTMGNLLKLIPSLKEKIPTLDSLLPILSEQAPLQNTKNALTTIAVPQQAQPPLDELISPPVLVPKLQMIKSPPAVPFCATHIGTITFHFNCNQL